MANVIKVVLRNIPKTSIKFTSNVSPNFFKSNVRTLYSSATLGLDTYKEQCLRTQNQLASIKDKFKSKMSEYTMEDSKNMIFTEDLKNMIHIAEEEDLETVVKMINRFNDQNKELRFGSFVFGPVVLRMFYHLDKPDLALDCFNSPKFDGFFDQLISYQILLDLLFNHERYNDVLKTFDLIKERQAGGMKFPRNIIVLVMGACYKLNTPESLNYALKLWNELNQVGHLPLRRAITFCAGLVLQNDKPEIVLELLANVKNQNYTTVRNLKVLSLMKIGRWDQLLEILKSVLVPQMGDRKPTFNKEVLEELKKGFEKCESKESRTEFERILQQIQELGHVENKTLDEQLCSEIANPQFLEQNKNRQFGSNNRFQQGNRSNNRFDFQRPQFNRRPGLEELQ